MTLGPGRTIVGRESGDILLHDPETSALHAEVEFTKGHVIVRDLGSRNGTWREGKRLPQFALYHGQSFRCGATDITLVEIQDANTPVAGGTASGSEDGRASSTLPSGAVLRETAAQTMSRGLVSPSSAATTPGDENPATMLGLAPPPGLGGPPTATPPATSPVASPAPVVGAPAAGAPSDPGHAVAPPPSSPPTGVPQPVPAAASAPIAPVANAVIKLGDAQPRAAKHRSPVDRAARRRLITRVVLGLVGAGLLGGLIYGIVTLIKGRSQAFVQQLAREMPQDTVGILALSSPRAGLELFGDEVPAVIREQLSEDLGLDPFDPSTLESWGFDLDEPMGVSLLDGEGMVAISVGVRDGDALRSALSSKAAELIDAEEELRWIERSFEETPGLWLDEPSSVAALLPKGRVIFVAGGPAEEVAKHAKRIAATTRGQTLADRPGFGELAPEPGKLLMALYVDGASSRAALPNDDDDIGARMALANIDGLAVLLSEDGPRIHLSTQTIMREGSDTLAVFEDVRREGTLLDRIPAPVLAELDVVFSPEQVREHLGSAGLMGMGLGFGVVEEALRKETGLDLRNDVLDNLDGQYGMVLQRLPGEDSREEPVAVLAWVGLRDEEAAKKAAERFLGETESKLDIELEQVEGTTVYVVDDRPKVSYFIHDGVLWTTFGRVDIPQIIKGDGTPFRKEPRLPALDKATDPGGIMAGFIDLRPIIDAVREQMDDDEREELDDWSAVLSQLEALTLRGELDGRTFVTRFTLHTSGEHALADLSQAVLKVVGVEMAEKMARKRRRKQCDELIDHILELMRADINNAAAESDLIDRRYELLTKCNEDETSDAEIECMSKADDIAALQRCEEGSQGGEDDDGEGSDGGITPVDVLELGEPVPVTYDEDIWPNTVSSGTATGMPDASVNYAVPLGADPVVRGPEHALVTVVMFGDFQCPYCKRVLSTLDQLLASDSEVRLVFRHNPLPMHDKAQIAAQAAIAAGRQGKFWPMHDKLYENQGGLNEEAFRTWADELGLDLVRFDRDYHDATTVAQIEVDIADSKKLGATGTPAFFVNGRYLGGAQPLHAFETVVAEEKARAEIFVGRRGNTRKGLYADMIGRFAPEVIAPPSTPVAPAVAETRYTIDTTGLPRLGAAGYVPVEIVECGDLDCPFCKRAEATMDQILADYEGKVALYWLHNPLSFHPGAEPAARAAVAAHLQGKFWQMQDKLIADKDKRAEGDFIGYASELGLDTKQFELDLSDTETAQAVSDQQKICTDNDARGTPSFFINGRPLAGAQPYDKFKEVIEQELAGGI